ncbi:MAG: Ldh family oxidoreductase [Pseudomonadota bacterium]
MYCGKILVRSQTTPENAAAVARALVAAEADGLAGHGLSRLPSYAAQADSGKVKGDAVPAVQDRAPAVMAIDADHGFAYPALEMAVKLLPPRARIFGMASAAIHKSHHCGAMGLVVEQIAEAGYVALMMANTPQAMAPWGGARALFGTNPVAFAAPIPGRPPMVIDMSMSKVARGKIMKASQDDDGVIPEGWALDADGNPTTDPKAALDGTMVPMGDAKGAALAMMIEVMSAAMTSARFSYEASSFFTASGDPPGTGQFLMVFDPYAFAGNSYSTRMTGLVTEIEDQQGVRLPGARRFAAREEARVNGIVVPAPVIEACGAP